MPGCRPAGEAAITPLTLEVIGIREYVVVFFLPVCKYFNLLVIHEDKPLRK